MQIKSFTPAEIFTTSEHETFIKLHLDDGVSWWQRLGGNLIRLHDHQKVVQVEKDYAIQVIKDFESDKNA